MATITGSNLYEINKELMKKEPYLTISDIKVKKKLIDEFFRIKDRDDLNFFHEYRYFMLLCKERADYTVFNLRNDRKTTFDTSTNILVDECLMNRGKIKGIDELEDGSAIEIWLEINKEIYCYYLFPCNNMIIEVGGD